MHVKKTKLAIKFTKFDAQNIDIGRQSSSLAYIEKKVFSEHAVKKLKKYYWPGNIRQLQNLCHFASIMTPVNEITYEDIAHDFFVDKITNKKDEDWENN